ncbi:hypothetical protein [Methylobacterium oxalidis]|nr:hypothetical protein [Methylobacterium oxalidis]
MQRPVRGYGAFDHTYVTSDCGFVWRCFGRWQGGGEICRDLGDSRIAHCLAGPDATAGIVYGVTGVCHQAANRILHPANRITVSSARGYAVSRVAFGPYGDGPWGRLASCCRGEAALLGEGRARSGTSVAGADAALASGHPPSRSRGEPHVVETEMSERIRDLRDMVRSNSAVAMDDARFQAFVDAQSAFWRRKDALARELGAGAITPEDYREGFGRALAESMTASKAAIGGSAFYAIFGESGDAAAELIDPDIFEEVHRPHHALRPF